MPASAAASSSPSASAHPAWSTTRRAPSRARATSPTGRAPIPLGEKLEAAFDAPIALSNDVNVATMAEFELGAAKPYRSILGVFWGTGVGGGVVLDGKLWEGKGGAGEIGHMVVKSDGRDLSLRADRLHGGLRRPRRDGDAAREKVADGEKTILFEIMEERGKPRLSSGIWQRALEKDDEMAQHMIDRAVGAIGIAVASSLNLLDVEAIIVGGGLGTAARRPLRGEDPRRDDAAPVRRPPAAGRPARLARRPRRRDRRDAARRREGPRPRLISGARRRSSGRAAPRTRAARPASRAAARDGRPRRSR